MGEAISSVIIAGAAELISTLGGDPVEIARQAGVPIAALTDPSLLVLGYAMSDFFEVAAERCDYRNFGLRMAERSSLAVTGNVWSLLSTAPTIGQMAEDLVANFGVYSEAGIIGLSRTDDGALMSFEARAGHCESEIQMMEYSLAISCNEMRRHCRADWNPPMVQFRHGAPADLELHTQIFGPNLMFEQDRNTIFMDTETLAQERRQAPDRSREIAERRLRRLQREQRFNLSRRVETAVRTRGPLAECSIAKVGAALGTTPRSLQRHLANEGTSFRTIVETVRADLALKYVRQSTLELGQIAELLGYCELSAFTRAFRRWHGRTAISIRREQSERDRCGRAFGDQLLPRPARAGLLPTT